MLPDAQSGLQVLIMRSPVPLAVVAVQVVHVMPLIVTPPSAQAVVRPVGCERGLSLGSAGAHHATSGNGARVGTGAGGGLG